MLLYIAPPVVVAVSLIVAALLLRRYLPRPGAGPSGVACVRCGTPAAALSPDSFACPGCRHDVREQGLAPWPPSSPTGRLWAALVFTLLLALATVISTGMAANMVPKEECFIADAPFASPQSGAYVDVNVLAVGRGKPGRRGPWRWHLLADLSLLDGRTTSLLADGPPTRWRALDDDGREVGSGAALDESAVALWMRAGGVNAEDERVRAEADEVLAAMQGLVEPGRSRRPTVVRSGGGFSSMGSRSGRAMVDTQWVMPALVAAWSVVWVLGLWVVLHPRRPRHPSARIAVTPPPRSPALVASKARPSGPGGGVDS